MTLFQPFVADWFYGPTRQSLQHYVDINALLNSIKIVDSIIQITLSMHKWVVDNTTATISRSNNSCQLFLDNFASLGQLGLYSVTRHLNYFFNIWPFTSMKISPMA